MFITPSEWASNHIHMVGWGSVVSFVAWLWWKTIRFATTFQEREKAGTKAMEQIDDLATNHFPHIVRKARGKDYSAQHSGARRRRGARPWLGVRQ
jgi:hypothetical protein